MASRNAFLAFAPSDDERHALAAALTEASPGHPLPGRRVRPENWHITLRFLGDVNDDVCDRVAAFIDEEMPANPGRIACTGLGAFPRASKAGVVYASVDDPDRVLAALADIGEEAATAAGLDPEGRPFVPHLTLARLRPNLDVRPVLDAFGEFRVPMHIRRIALFRTEAVRGVVSYRPLHEFDL